MTIDNGIPEITVEQLHAARIEKRDFYLLDVRTLPEYEAGRLSFTDALVPYDQLHLYVDRLPSDKSTPIYSFCRSGRRSGITTEFLQALGYSNARNVRGGIIDWVDAGYEIDSGPVDRPPR